VTINPLQLVIPAMTIDGRGSVDVIGRYLEMSADVVIFGTASEVLGLVPVVGKTAADLISMRASLEGPMENPNIQVRPLGGVTDGIRNALRGAGKTVEGWLGGSRK